MDKNELLWIAKHLSEMYEETVEEDKTGNDYGKMYNAGFRCAIHVVLDNIKLYSYDKDIIDFTTDFLEKHNL